MARQLRICYPGACYHITSRGNERKEIFKTPKDRQSFLSYLESASIRYGALIHGYCLMDNHYHLLMETPVGNLSQIMQHINGGYAAYFNVKHHRSGHLFQGRYKAILVDADEYAQQLSRYIHLNPVRAGIVDKPERYPWSSYLYFIGNKKAPQWLVMDLILSYFGRGVSEAKKGYREFVDAMLGQEYNSLLDDVVSSTILGCVDFVKEIKDKYLKGKNTDRNLPALRALSDRPAIEKIEEEVEIVLGADNALSRKVKLYLCHRYSGRKLTDIGTHFAIGESGVSQASYRVSLQIRTDKKLRQQIMSIEKGLELSTV